MNSLRPPDWISVRVSTFVKVNVTLDTTVSAGITEVLVTRLVTGTSDVTVARKRIASAAARTLTHTDTEAGNKLTSTSSLSDRHWSSLRRDISDG